MIISLAGIALTLATFLLAYWKTEGARKERERNVRKDIVSTLARNLANGDTCINRQVIDAIIRSKCRDYKVNLSSADEFPRVMDDVLSKFVDNDFIPSELRAKLVDSASRLRAAPEGEELDLENVLRAQQESQADSRTSPNIWPIAVSGAVTLLMLLAVVVVLSPPAREVAVYLSAVAATLAGSAVVATTGAAAERRRVLKRRALLAEGSLQNIIRRHLTELVPPEKLRENVNGSDGRRLDFVVLSGSGPIPIEVKSGPAGREALSQVGAAMRAMEAKKAVLVTSSGDTPQAIRALAATSGIDIIEASTTDASLARSLKRAIATDIQR